MDGAWRSLDNEGVAAWVPIKPNTHEGTQGGIIRIKACSAEVVEAKACCAALQWAVKEGLSKVTIYTDCLMLVKAIKEPQ